MNETSKRIAAEAVERMVDQITTEYAFNTCKQDKDPKKNLAQCKKNFPAVFRPDQMESLIYKARELVEQTNRKLIGRAEMKGLNQSTRQTEKQAVINALAAMLPAS